ncbi:ABC transporter ATP-binding protein [bacterium]|nr:ABC transporter ATP-binding protein [bacterium]
MTSLALLPAVDAPPASSWSAPAPDAEPLPHLELRGLTKDYRHNWTMRRLRVLHALDLVVRRGEILGLIGPNGAGKTTTFKCLLGLLRPSAGQVVFEGRPLDVRQRAAIGFLPEQPYFYDYLTVRETLSLYAHLYGMHGGAARARVAEVIEQVQLGPKQRASLRTLSKGTMQRVGIAQAILNRPRLLILDEPMSGLDPIGRHAMRELIRSLHAGGTTVIFSSHILPDAEALCDRVAILTGGRLREIIDLRLDAGATVYHLVVGALPAEILTALERLAGAPPMPQGSGWRLRLPGSNIVGPALDLVRNAGGTVESLVPAHPSLEERFLAHVGATSLE